MTQCGSNAAATPFRVLAALLLLGVGACSKPLERAECDALLERYTELLVRSDRPTTSAAELVKLQAAARDRATHDRDFAQCPSRVSRRAFECAMSAENVDRLEQCLL